MCPSSAKLVVVAALYHDSGKIRIPESILFKPGKLTDDEWDIIKQHPVVGAKLIEKGNGEMGLDGELPKVVSAVRHHHEWWNGDGYPDGLIGEQIPLFSRILAVADAFDAMTTDRPYRKALSAGEALKEILKFSGKQFDPRVARVFREIIANCSTFIAG